MPSKLKNFLPLGVALVVIVGAIGYLEWQKMRVSMALGGSLAGVVAPAGEVTASSTPEQVAARETRVAKKTALYSVAHEIVPGGGFINASPFALEDIVGKKVILVDFWTYSCINCLRTIPYLNEWYAKYHDRGLEVIGVHTPEFGFEKDLTNLSQAVAKLGIKYPVVQDNAMATWNTYQNQYWPHEYLIDIDGFVVHDAIGEGGYDNTERAIQEALKERADLLGIKEMARTAVSVPSDAVAIDFNKVGSPETYFGAGRNQYLANGAQGSTGIQHLSLPTDTTPNHLYLGGDWNFVDEFAGNSSTEAKIFFQYNARNVYFVASADKPVRITVRRDGKAVGAERGSDVGADASATIHENRLYHLIQERDYGTHTVEIIIRDTGLKAYTFTFG